MQGARKAHSRISFIEDDDLVPALGKRDLLLRKRLDLVAHHVDTSGSDGGTASAPTHSSGSCCRLLTVRHLHSALGLPRGMHRPAVRAPRRARSSSFRYLASPAQVRGESVSWATLALRMPHTPSASLLESIYAPPSAVARTAVHLIAHLTPRVTYVPK